LSARCGGGAYRLRAHLRRHLRLPLLRPRHRADLRAPLAARRSPAPMRRLAVVALVALAFPATAFAHANLDSTSPTYRQRLHAPAERRFFLVAGAGVVATLEVGILAFMLRAEDALQLPFGRLLYGDLSSIAGGTRFGEAFIAMTLGYALVAAFVFLAWLTDRRFLLWPALVLGLGFASGLSL